MTSFNILGGGVAAQETTHRMKVATDRLTELETLANESRSALDFLEDGLDDVEQDDFLSGPTVDWFPGMRAFLGLPWLPTSEVPTELDCGFTKARYTVFLTFSEPDSKVGVFTFFMSATAIVASIVSFCVSTFTEYRRRAVQGTIGFPEMVFAEVEIVCVSIFTVEYVSRLLTATAVPSAYERAYLSRYGLQTVLGRTNPLAWPRTFVGVVQMVRASLWKLLRFILSPLNIIDAVAIAPFYYSILSSDDVAGNLLIVRVLRLARVFRLARMSKRMEGVQILASTMVTAVDALGFLAFFLLLAVIMFGTVIFFCEGGDYDARLDDFVRPNLLGNAMEVSPFKSIPHAFWWTVVTMTTVGYGDMYPTTPAGRTLGSFIMLCGIMVLALPITVVGSAFTEEYAKYKERRLIKMINDEEKKQRDLQDEHHAHMISSAAASSSSDPSATPALQQGGVSNKPSDPAQGTAIPSRSPPLGPVQGGSPERTQEQHVVAMQENSTGGGSAAGLPPSSVTGVQAPSETPLLSFKQASHRSLTSLLGSVKMLGMRNSNRSTEMPTPRRMGSVGGSVDRLQDAAAEEGSQVKDTAASPRSQERAAPHKPTMSKTSRRELDLLVAMRRGRARLQAVTSMEAALKTGRIPLTAEAVYTGQLGGGIGPLSIASPLGLAAETSVAVSDMTEQLSKQMHEQQTESQRDSERIQAVLESQARDVARLTEDVASMKATLDALLQAVQYGQSGVHLPGSVQKVD